MLRRAQVQIEGYDRLPFGGILQREVLDALASTDADALEAAVLAHRQRPSARVRSEVLTTFEQVDGAAIRQADTFCAPPKA
jgi:hypothetical protein